jgi:hypothetical protein
MEEAVLKKSVALAVGQVGVSVKVDVRESPPFAVAGLQLRRTAARLFLKAKWIRRPVLHDQLPETPDLLTVSGKRLEHSWRRKLFRAREEEKTMASFARNCDRLKPRFPLVPSFVEMTDGSQ